MKRFQHRLSVLLLIAILTAFLQVISPTTIVSAAETAPMIVIVVRHAERATEPGDDPNISKIGMERAEKLAQILANSGINAIYTSSRKRTRQTAQPLAMKLGLMVTEHDPRDTAALIIQLKAKEAGHKVLVVGHSNTVPDIIKALGAANPPTIDDDEFGDLFVVTVYAPGKATYIRLKY